MIEKSPFLIEDIDVLRKQIMNGELTGKKEELWNLIRTSSRNAPMDFGWFVPFVALITKEKEDVENARKIIFTYIDKLDPMSFCSGMQYHFWCFAFPHAKMCIYFQWLCTITAFSEDEEKYIKEHLINYHFVNFFYGMRTKPDPECIDNQTLSLCLSTTIVGYIFSQGRNPSKMAEIMLREGKKRLPGVIGDMPLSGYSGEGSSYMDCVNGPAIPLAVEVLERISGEKDLLFKEFAPSGAKPVSVLKMVAREFMPGGLLLPWDNYGYQFGVRSTLAYGALKTGEKIFYNILEKECIWTYDIGIGWAYDDLVWTLCWWPKNQPINEEDGSNWFEPAAGGTLVSRDTNHYLIQMWDESTPNIPTRAHVNPNAVLLNGYKVPVSADGSPMPNKAHSFQFEDTWRSVGFISINTETRYNYGDGCCGAHSGIIIDDCEGMRAHKEYVQVEDTGYQVGEEHYVYADVTPIYQENFTDIHKVFRKSSFHCQRFYLIEDYVKGENEHKITSRFLFRPNVEVKDEIVKVRTPEGVVLQLMELLGNSSITTRRIMNHPFKPDGCSELVDYSINGNEVRRLFLVFMSNTLKEDTQIVDFKVIGDQEGILDYQEAVKKLDASSMTVPMNLPAYMETSLPNYKTWWYQKKIEKKPGKSFIKLPVGMWEPRLFVNDMEIDLASFAISGELIAPRVELPEQYNEETQLNVVIKVEVPVGHYDGGGDGTVGMTGGVCLCYPTKEEVIENVSYRNEQIEVRTNQNKYTGFYHLLQHKADGKGDEDGK